MMEHYQREISVIQKILKENPKGMTVTDIARKMKINRNSVAKYLDVMRISGHVEMITFGPAKVFFPSRRVPLSNLLNYISDYILVFDKDLKITMINDSFLGFLKTKREQIIGEAFKETIFPIFHDNSDFSEAVDEALEGKDFTKELEFNDEEEDISFKVKVIPATFRDGRFGVALVIKNENE